LHRDDGWSGELVHTRADGTRITTLCQWVLDRGANGNPPSIVATYRDITERKRAEEEIVRLNRELQNRVDELQTILNVIPIGVAIAQDPACHHITLNPYMSDLLAVPSGANASLSAPPGERPTSYTNYRNGQEVPPDELPMQVACTGVEVQDFEVDLVRAGCDTRNLLCHSRPLFDGEGRVRGSVGAFLDISERRRLEDELRQRVEQLAEADRQKDHFLTMVAHELRNPLAPIRNAVHLLKQIGPEEPRLMRLRDVVERQVNQQARLLDDLLDISRITRGMIALHPKRLELVRLVRDAAEDCSGVLEAAGLALSLQLPAEPVWVEGDPTRLSQVVSNLLQNSAKFTDRGGHVTVQMAVEPDGERVAVCVHDTGIGIKAEMLPHVFETFAQADRSLARTQGGLGLGLALVKGLVELHQGEVRAESAGSGRGSTFTVLLPLALSAGEAVKAAAPPALSTGPMRILIVEDNRDAADTLREVLELSGCTVAVAYSGTEALEMAGQFRPEVVLCDLGLPGISGYEVAAALRKDRNQANVRLIALSGYAHEEDQRRSREAGFDLHLTKPVDLNELQRLLAVRPERQQI
jgi:signal transduction histidine kinase/ActR/RegA family two-component response regulator